MFDIRSLRHLNISILALALTTSICGLFFLQSATGSNQSSLLSPIVVRQLIWLLLGLGVAIFFLYLDYEFLKNLVVPIYVINLVLLGVVLIIGAERGGSQRWIAFGAVSIQPAEFAKLFIIITLGTLLASRIEFMTRLQVVWRSFLHILPPLILIFLQPDLGTSAVIVCVWLGMLIAAGAKWTHWGLFILGGAILLAAAWQLDVIRPYQKERIQVLLGLGEQNEQASYQIQQSKIAIGAGKVLGKGFRKGTQSQLKFVPEQHTEFILTNVGEEWGFAGTMALLCLYFAILWQGFKIASKARDPFGGLVAVGIVSMLGAHVTVNIAMVTGIFPVTGLPLPFVSYGGSNLVLNMACVGLLSNIYMRRHRIRF